MVNPVNVKDALTGLTPGIEDLDIYLHHGEKVTFNLVVKFQEAGNELLTMVGNYAVPSLQRFATRTISRIFHPYHIRVPGNTPSGIVDIPKYEDGMDNPMTFYKVAILTAHLLVHIGTTIL